jgi:hypothetical protein
VFDAELQLVKVDRREVLNSALVVLVTAMLAMLLRWLMNPLLGEHLPFATFFIGGAVCVRYANQWAARAVALSGLAWGSLLYIPKG